MDRRVGPSHHFATPLSTLLTTASFDVYDLLICTGHSTIILEQSYSEVLYSALKPVVIVTTTLRSSGNAPSDVYANSKLFIGA